MIILSVFFFASLRLCEKKYLYLLALMTDFTMLILVSEDRLKNSFECFLFMLVSKQQCQVLTRNVV